MFSTKLSIFAAFICLLPTSRGAVFDVVVGGTGVLAFTPNQIQGANVGDVIQFHFKQKNHTVTQSSLATPCSPLPNGFDSQFVPVAANATDFPIAQLAVRDTKPIWVYCKQVGHCQAGMIFAVNPGNNFSTFQANAAASATNGSAASVSAPAAVSTTSAAVAAITSVVTVTATVTVNGGPVTTTYGSYPGSAAPTSPISTDHKVIVGGTAGLVYSPSNITAQPGDTVTFEFHAKNHTVTASSFADPCRALSLTSTTSQLGFDSGFMPVAADATSFPTFTIQINDTKPIWGYCRQAGHCGQGMVFSINAVETGPNNFDAFKTNAFTLNGTATSASASASGSGSAASATPSANSAHTVRAGATIALIGAVVGMLL